MSYRAIIGHGALIPAVLRRRAATTDDRGRFWGRAEQLFGSLHPLRAA